MIRLVFAAWLGGVLTVALLWPYGMLIALVAAPFGGSFLAVAALLYVALRGAERAKEPQVAETQATDKMVAVL